MTGLTEAQLKGLRDWTYNYIEGDENPADASQMDANANITLKNVVNMTTELHKYANIQLNRYIIQERIEKLFSKKIADKYAEQLGKHEIYCHDESHPFLPYCVAIDSTPYIYEGLKGVGGETTPPKHLHSYCGGYINLIYAIASQFAGAVADVSMLRDFHFFAKKDFGDDYLVTNKKQIESSLSQIVYSLNMPAGIRGFQSVFYNISVFDEFYFKGLYETAMYPDGTKVIDEWEGINKLQKFFLTWFNKEREVSLLTFPVVTCALKLKGDEVESQDWKNIVAKEFSEGNSFFIYMDENVSSLSSCCRLRNDISRQLDNTFSYSLGAGGISTGSMNVITINVNRMIQDGKDLGEQLDLIYQYQTAFADWFYFMKSKGKLPIYDAGFIALEKQYLTIGVNGVVEAAEFLGMKPTYNKEYISWLQGLLGFIKDKNKEASEKYSKIFGHKLMFNTEFVPAENLGVKFYDWDKRDGYQVPEKRNLYNSYFYAVEDKNISAIDKIRLYGRETIKYLDGGSALHLNMQEHLTEDGWKAMLDATAKAGTNYWTYNVRSTVCNECGYIGKKDLPRCIKCGSDNVDKATRVIGYLRRESNFSKARRIEASKRFKHKVI